eukprot:TRINITY_DN18091_c0_g1_i1.p1 TRINITY_DN18091_c0_g1~~TRINITY_DN18091_c0_g1_i1.p1  ORF type:complete len:584 (-),score=37.07 TRINITY_DN18091_c0_g1_i1:526-2277(-)
MNDGQREAGATEAGGSTAQSIWSSIRFELFPQNPLSPFSSPSRRLRRNILVARTFLATILILFLLTISGAFTYLTKGNKHGPGYFSTSSIFSGRSRNLRASNCLCNCTNGSSNSSASSFPGTPTDGADRLRAGGAAEGLQTKDQKCSSSLPRSTPERPLIIAITPTYVRASQTVHFVRSSTVLRLVPPPVLWIVIESVEKTKDTADLLEQTAGRCIRVGAARKCSQIDYVHITAGRPHEKPSRTRGVYQRNAGLDYVQSRRLEGVIYFMDDDNNYSPELFEEIRKVTRVGAMPVGFLWSWTEALLTPGRDFRPFVERPLVTKIGVDANGKAIGKIFGWETFAWAARKQGKSARKFQSDMAGFSFRSELLWERTNLWTKRPDHPVRFQSVPGYIETNFLNKLVENPSDLLPLANNCQKVLVWHTKLECSRSEPYPRNWWLPQPPRDRFICPDKNATRLPAHYVVNQTRHELIDDPRVRRDGTNGTWFGYIGAEEGNDWKNSSRRAASALKSATAARNTADVTEKEPTGASQVSLGQDSVGQKHVNLVELLRKELSAASHKMDLQTDSQTKSLPVDTVESLSHNG